MLLGTFSCRLLGFTNIKFTAMVANNVVNDILIGAPRSAKLCFANANVHIGMAQFTP